MASGGKRNNTGRKRLSKEYNLPKLVGTEKQKFFAEAIRSRWINLYKDMLEEDKDNIKLDSEEISWKEISKEKSELEMNCAIYFFRKNKKYILKYEGIKTDEIVILFHDFNYNWNKKYLTWEKEFKDIKEAKNDFNILLKTFLRYGFVINIPNKIIEGYDN